MTNPQSVGLSHLGAPQGWPDFNDRIGHAPVGMFRPESNSDFTMYGERDGVCRATLTKAMGTAFAPKGDGFPRPRSTVADRRIGPAAGQLHGGGRRLIWIPRGAPAESKRRVDNIGGPSR